MKVQVLHPRNNSLDALRGIAILGMVLSGSIAFGGVLPAWMYHAQVPPPMHKFNPDLPGITWVDLVFPFFLFSMGAAMPMALNKWKDTLNATPQVWWIAIRRWLLLTWFAIFSHQMKAWVLSENPQTSHYLISITAFLLLFAQLFQWPASISKTLSSGIKIFSFAIAVFLLYYMPTLNGKTFQWQQSDIIIIVLGNMAFFGTLIFWYTKDHIGYRLAILPFIMAIFLGAKITGSWNETFFNWSPIPWMYKFYYLKYLFIVIPGTIAGQWLMERKSAEQIPEALSKKLGVLLMVIVFANVIWLFQRLLVVNAASTAILLIAGYYLLKPYGGSKVYKLFLSGAYLLLLGLFFEAYENGIKKDSSTYSYYFVTTGLAIFMLLIFMAIQNTGTGSKVNAALASNGRNPMVAYIAGSLLLTPLLHISHLQQYLNLLNGNAIEGFLKGFIFTSIVAFITYYFSRQKWYWKT